ncbi:glycosyl hydrolase [Trebonia kvetii]|uniref:Glycosyl hydrolase n=1 Tax=Trebonia kvetii TaxID=2480626 RepID=A0A6P2C5H4_9ACTN|nr:glycosyl hydrolase [Trebonia kvetii]TVZ05381.1 glycosyl hydrolase [Trebonia kvetii]
MSYRDPVYDGATDPVVVLNRARGEWWMLYTQRRASAPGPGVAWVHGSDIGVAVSRDGGGSWLYRGTVQGLDFEPGRNTFWAPEVFWAEGQYHMLVTYIRGVPDRWEGHDRQIRHYVSPDLWRWSDLGPLHLNSRRAIDAAVCRLPSGGYRLWFKDEERESHTYACDSADLTAWTPPQPTITGAAHEGPNVFALDGCFWMLTDEWRGLAAYRSDDLTQWRRTGMILDIPGTGPDDTDVGRHADVAECGDRAFIFYFTHPGLASAADKDSYQARRSVVLAAELAVTNGSLRCLRDKPLSAPFLPVS